MPVPPAPPNNIPLASSLPRVSFRRIPADEAQVLATPAGVTDQQNVNFGFNDGSAFAKPEHYLRYVEPIEADLKKQVEYDMDEQDQEWLDALNQDRKRDQLDTISYEVFEIIIDRLEKEWFDLMRLVPPKPQPVQTGADGEPLGDGSEDTACAICDDGECENSNAIVFCDGCNLAVHQDCYGIPYIPEGQWLCRKCTVSPDRAVSCVLCPNEGGAFKQTTQGKWAHLLCAMWIPETGVSNPVYMEPIDSVERIPKARWKLQCSICRGRHGACIQCDNKSCFTAFHVTCARKAGFLIKSSRQRMLHSPEDSDDEDGGETFKACCRKHMPKEMRKALQQRQRQDQQGLKRQDSIPEEDEDEDDDEEEEDEEADEDAWGASRKRRRSNTSGTAVSIADAAVAKSARAYKASYRAGPPLVPVYVVDRVLEYVAKIPLRRKMELVHRIARFWSLKREARRGAPLLKRLHLEPWTASNANQEQTDAERLAKLQYLLRLREDLERVRMLAELVRKREKEKLRQVQLVRTTLLQGILFPYHGMLRKVLDRAMALDRSNLFLHPVSREDVPDYYDIVRLPMDWSTIMGKLDTFSYTSIEAFEADVLLVVDNAILYNKADTTFHRVALRIKKAAQQMFEELAPLRDVHNSAADAGSPSARASSNSLSDLALEPEAAILSLLAEYDEAEKTAAVNSPQDLPSAPHNAVEDLLRQYFRDGQAVAGPSRPARSSAPTSGRAPRALQPEAPRGSGTGKGKGSQAQGANGSRTSSSKGKGAMRTPGSSRRQPRPPGSGISEAKRLSALMASRAAVLARQRKKQEADKKLQQKEDEKRQRAAKRQQQRQQQQQLQQHQQQQPQQQQHEQDEQQQHRTAKRRRSSTPNSEERALLEKRDRALPEPTHLEVEQVDSWDSFKRFNVGWVLPEGTRRRRTTSGHAAGAEQPIGLAEGSARADSQPVAESSAFSSASELTDDEEDGVEGSKTVNGGGHRKATTSTAPRSASAPAKPRKMKRSRSASDKLSATGRIDPRRLQKRGSHGQFIRKDEDPNKPRAPKGQGKAALRANKLLHGIGSSSSSAAKRKRARAKWAADKASNPFSSPLTSDEEGFEDEEDDEAGETDPDAAAAAERERRNAARREKHRLKRLAEARDQQTNRDRLRKRREEAARMREQVANTTSSSGNGTEARVPSGSAQDLEVGTMVWAKTTGYPYFPGEIWDDLAEDVPDEVLAKRDDLPPSTLKESPALLVRFFDNGRTFSWLPPSRLKLMCEDEALDKSMLTQTNISPHHRSAVRAAYARAQAVAA